MADHDADRLEGLTAEDRAAVEQARQAGDGTLEERGRARLEADVERRRPDVLAGRVADLMGRALRAHSYLDAARRRAPLPDAVLERLTREQRDELNVARIAELEQAIDSALGVLGD